MINMTTLSCLYLIPLLTAILFSLPVRIFWLGKIQVLSNLLLLAVVWQLTSGILHDGPQLLWNKLIYMDALSMLMLLLISVVGLLVAIYSIGYMLDEHEEKITNHWKPRMFYALFNLFVFSMIVMVTSGGIGVFWIAIETSTIVSAFLVGYYNKKESIEAAWKYIILCTVGIAFALIGIILTYYAAQKVNPGAGHDLLGWSYLHSIAPTLDHSLIKISFIFILIGFGTKAGLAPMHNWLPDAHSESPTPVSALLSAVLLKCSLYGVIRYSMIVSATTDTLFSQHFLLFFGLFSVGISVPFILLQKNIKRLLAYSSIEHIGIITMGIGFGSPLAVFGALFHMINHALAKTIMFFAAGNLSLKYHTKSLPQFYSVISKMPLTGTFLLLAGLALAGTPPFSVFLSEFYIAWGGISGGHWLATCLFVLFLVIVFGGFAYQLITAAIGPQPVETETLKELPAGEMNYSGIIAIAIPFVLLLIFTWYLPEPLFTLLNQATNIISGGRL